MRNFFIISLVTIFILIVVLVTLLSVFIHTSFKDDRPEQGDLIVDVPIPFEKEVTTIKDGLDVAYDLAKKWDERALCTTIIARFEGKEYVMNKNGLISYAFEVDNLGLLGNSGKVCYIKIDLEQQAIFDFVAYGEAPDIGHNTPKDFYKANIDIKEAFEIVEKKLGKETLYKYKEPAVVISAGQEVWIFDFYNQDEKIYSIRIDPDKGEVVDIEEE